MSFLPCFWSFSLSLNSVDSFALHTGDTVYPTNSIFHFLPPVTACSLPVVQQRKLEELIRPRTEICGVNVHPPCVSKKHRVAFWVAVCFVANALVLMLAHSIWTTVESVKEHRSDDDSRLALSHTPPRPTQVRIGPEGQVSKSPDNGILVEDNTIRPLPEPVFEYKTVSWTWKKLSSNGHCRPSELLQPPNSHSNYDLDADNSSDRDSTFLQCAPPTCSRDGMVPFTSTVFACMECPMFHHGA